jgi:tRNA threonylcarbamoyladenosine biosynthesis protein TsaB
MTAPDELSVAVAIETSTREPTVAARSGRATLESELAGARAHASDLLPTLARLLAELGVEPAGIGTVVVGTGPGSYTGLRVGIATALGLARAHGCALVAVPSTESRVRSSVPAGGAAAVVIDARANEIYFARYRRAGERIEVVEPPSVVPAGEIAARLAPGEVVLADEDAVRAAGLDRRGDLRIDLRSRPRAVATLELGLARLAERGPDDPALVEPLYLRAFAARSRRR